MSVHGGGGSSDVGVTCVLPTHARPADLTSSVSSVLAQSRLPDALLVVDDVGDAASRDVVGAARARSGIDVRLLEHLDGTGASSSRNRGAREATTEFVASLDDDDVWRPRFLELALARLQQSGADLVVTGIERLRLDGRRQAIVAPRAVSREDLLHRNPGITGTNMVIRRSAFLEVGGFDEQLRVFNDWDLFIACRLAGLRYEVVPDLLVEWREHGGERLSTLSPRRADGIQAFVDKHRRLISADQRAHFEAVVLGIRRRTAPTLAGRALATGRLLRLRLRPRRREVPPPSPTDHVRGHLLFPHSRDGLGGSVITGALQARDLQATGRWRATVVVNGEGPVAAYHRSLGLPTELLDGMGRTRHRPRPDDGNALRRIHKRALIVLRAQHYLRQHPVDVVHVNDESSALGWGLAARRRGTPMVWHVHQQRPQRIDPLLLRLSAHLVFVADANRVRFARPLGVPSTTIHNTVDTSVFVPVPQGPGRTAVRLGFVSNLVPRKRPEWVVRLGAALLDEGFDVEVVVVGADFTGDAVAQLTSSPAGQRLGARLSCPGRSDDVPRVLQGIDVLLLPSMRDREAFPRIVVEAMSCGLPVVATAVAGVPEAVEDGVTGLLVDPDDFDAFRAAVTSLVADPVVRRTMGAAGRDAAVRRFSAESTLAALEGVYQRLVG